MRLRTSGVGRRSKDMKEGRYSVDRTPATPATAWPRCNGGLRAGIASANGAVR